MERLVGIVTALSLAATPALCADCTPEALAGLWRVVTVGDDTLSGAAEIRFDTPARVAAHLGCNRMAGNYTLAHGVLRAGPMAATRMACPEPLMARDTRLAEVFATGAACRITATGDLHLGTETAPDLTATR